MLLDWLFSNINFYIVEGNLLLLPVDVNGQLCISLVLLTSDLPAFRRSGFWCLLSDYGHKHLTFPHNLARIVTIAIAEKVHVRFTIFQFVSTLNFNGFVT